MGSMSVSSSNVFLFSILLGMIISIIYDFFKIINFINHKNNKIIFFSDIFFMFIAALISFLYILASNYGIFRIYILFGELIGFIIYRYTLGNLFYNLVISILKFTTKIYRRIIKLLMNIFNKIYYYISKLILKKFHNKNNNQNEL